MKNYVAGFLFSGSGDSVAVVEKKKFPPGFDWTLTPLNAIGGKVEEGESSFYAMAREFEEETGVRVLPNEWDLFLTISTSSWRVDFFRLFDSTRLDKVETKEEERILEIHTNPLSRRVVPNLKWIVPMALNKDVVFAEVREKE